MRRPVERGLMDFKERRIGLEFENPIIDAHNQAVSFRLMQEVWADFAKLGWRLKTEKISKIITGANKNFHIGIGRVILSSDVAAGNLEMSLPPTSSLQEAETLLGIVRREVLRVIKKHRLSLLAIGMQPAEMRQIENLRTESDRFKAQVDLGVSDYFNNSLLVAISAHQVNVSTRPSELIGITNELIKITGLIVALCGNSPIQNWKILPWKEWRILVWDFRFLSKKVPAGKFGGFPANAFPSLAHLFRYYWNLPRAVLPARRDGLWVIPENKPDVLEYLREGKVRGKNMLGDTVALTPSPEDINLAMTAMWSFAKPHIIVDAQKATVSEFLQYFNKNTLEKYFGGKLANCYIECRAAAAAPIGEEMALPALVLGLVNNVSELRSLNEKYSWEEWRELVYSAAAHGLEAKIRGKNIYGLMDRLIAIADRGLRLRHMDEERYLAPLRKRITTRQNPADLAIAAFREGNRKFLDLVTYKK